MTLIKARVTTSLKFNNLGSSEKVFYAEDKNRARNEALSKTYKNSRQFIPPSKKSKKEGEFENRDKTNKTFQPSEGESNGQWGLKVDKINSSVSKFRKHNLLKK